MKIQISRDGERLTSAEVVDTHAVPQCLLACSEHYGGGEYVAAEEDGRRIFRLDAEWLDD